MKNRKKVISFILTLILLFGLVPMGLPGGVDEVYATPSDPSATFDSTFSSTSGIYLIQTVVELASFAALVNEGKPTVGLSFEITGTGISLAGIDWTPIGTSQAAFSGTFNGNDQTISGVTFSTSAALGYYDGTGFFGCTSGASISNLNLVGVSISAINRSNVGGLVGFSTNTTISGVTATGTVTGSRNVGGLVGYAKNTTISGVVVTGSVACLFNNVGGLVGNNESGNIEESHTNVVVTGTGDFVGGLVGYCVSGSIKTSYATGAVTGTKNSVGGLVGFCDSGNIETSYATGDVIGVDHIGGLVGHNSGDSGNIIKSCYAIGAVAGTASAIAVGGLVGYNNKTTIAGCFWDTETSGTASDAAISGSTGLSTAVMNTQTTFTNAGWDFMDTWVMGNASISYYYPVFQYAYPLINNDVDTPPATHHHSTVVIAEPVKNLLRFNIGNTDSFITLGSSNEVLKSMDVAPILLEDRTLLPVRFVVEPLGGTIIWNEAEQKVTITRGETTIELWIGNNVAKVNGIDKAIDPDNALVKPMIVKPGRTMLPLRFISEALGCTVDWNVVNQEILVSNW